MGRGRQSEGSTAETVRKRPEIPRTAAITMEVLRRCPLAIAQRLCTEQLLFQLLCWTESLRQCPLRCCWRTTWTTWSKRRPTCSVHLPTHDLFWANLRVLLHLPPLRSLDLLFSSGTLLTQHWWSALIDDLRKSRGLHSVRASEHRSMPAGVAQSRHAFVGSTVSTWGRWRIPVNKRQKRHQKCRSNTHCLWGTCTDRIEGSPSW